MEFAMSKAEDALKSIDITIRGETADSLRSIEEIIDDVADAWDTLSDSQKQAVSEAMAGTQRSSMFSALIENYEKVKELRDAGLAAEGELAKANQVRVESLKGIQGQLEVTKEALYATIISDQEMSKILKGTDYLLQGLTGVVKFIKSNWIPTATMFVTSIYAADTAMRTNNWGVQYLVLDKFVPLMKNTISQFVTFNSKLVLSKQGLIDFTKGIKLTKLGMASLIGVAIQAGVALYQSYKRATPGVEDLRNQIQSLTSATEEFGRASSNLKEVKADTSSMREMVKIIEDENQSHETQQEKIKEVNGLLAQHASSYTSIESILKNENLAYESRIKMLERVAELEKKEAQTKAVEGLYSRDFWALGATAPDKMINSVKSEVGNLLRVYDDWVKAEQRVEKYGEKASKRTLAYAEMMSKGVEKQKNSVESVAIELANYYMNIKQLFDEGALDQSQYEHFLQYYKDGVEELKKATEGTNLDVELQLDIEDFMTKTTQAKTSVDDVKTKISELSDAMSKTDARATASSVSGLVSELNNLEEGSDEANTVLEQLHSTFTDMPNEVDTLADAIDYLNGKFKDTLEVADMKDLNEDYLESLEGIEEATKLLESFKDGLDVGELRSLFNSDLLADYNGSLTDSVAIQEHLNNKIAEMQEVAASSYFEMNRQSEDFWNNQIKNSQAWYDYEKQTQDELTRYLADSFGIQLGDFQAYIDSKGGLRSVDLSNAENLADAERILNGNLNGQLLGFFTQFINGKADARIDDMDNVVAFLKAQNGEEIKTIQQLANLWNDYYNAKKAEINATISTLKKVDVTASQVKNQIKDSGDKALANAGLQMPGIKNHYSQLYGQANQLKQDVQKATDELKLLETENNKFQSVLNKLNGYSATNTLKQDYVSANKGNYTGSGSGNKGSSGGKGSGSKDKNKNEDSKKEVADLDLKIDKFKEFEEAINRASEALERNQQAQRMVNSKSELKSLLADEINLMEKKKEALGKLQAEYKKEQQYLQSRLEISNLIFNKEGEIIGDKITGGSVTDRLKDAEKWSNAASGKEKEWRINDTTNFKNTIDAYYDLMNQLGKVSAEYNDMAYEIRQTKKAHEELLKQVENLADRYLKFEMKANALDNELSLNRRKQEYAVGVDLLNLRRRELEILEKQKVLNSDRISELQKERAELEKVVKDAGFEIGQDGTISNYDLVWKHKTYEYNQLAGMAAADYKDNLDKLAEQVDRYLEIVNGELPKAEEYYYDIADALKEIEEQQKEWAKQLEDVTKLLDRFYDVTKKLSKAENELALIESKLAIAQGDNKIALLKRQEEIYKAQSKLLNEQYEIQKSQMQEMRMQLIGLGVAFDSDGYVSNYEALVKSMQEKIQAMPGGEARDKAIKELEELLAKIEEYDDLVRNEIPSTEKSWWDLNASIKEAQKQQLQIIQDVQTSIANAIKNKWQENTQALQDEIDKQNEILNKQWKEEDWQDELGKAEMELNKLQAQIDNLSKDTSLSGQLKLEQLKEQYQEQLEAMNQMIKDHEREQASQMLEDEKSKLEEDMKQALSAENLANLVNEALATGMVKIGEEAITLNDLMIQNITKQEDAYYALGEVMKSEMLANLQEAKSLYMDISKISGDLVTGNTTIATNAFGDILSKLKLTGSKSILENNNSPLVSIVMQGKADESITLHEVEKVAKSQCDKLLVELNKIMG